MIPVNEPLLIGNEKKYLNECIQTGWISSEGPFVERFEKEMALFSNRKYATACCNGTAALDLAVTALGLGEGDEVIMPTFTIISCAQALIRHGVKISLVDCDPFTFNMSADDIELKITKNTKAIMVVHLYGLSVDIDPILELAKKYDLKVIEDAAEMIGQTYKGKPCGSFGDVSIYSFYPNKQITTGEGGMVLCNDELLDKRLKSHRNLCFGKDRFVHYDLGHNYRMTNLQAAIGVAQLERVESIIEKKRWIGDKYNELLGDLEMVNLPIQRTDFCENIYWVYTVVLKDEYNKTAKDIMNALAKFKIGTRPFFYPMHKQPVFLSKGLFHNESYPSSENLYEKGLYLPSGLALNENQIQEVSKCLREVLK
jgi:perosamine synthetase